MYLITVWIKKCNLLIYKQKDINALNARRNPFVLIGYSFLIYIQKEDSVLRMFILCKILNSPCFTKDFYSKFVLENVI